MRCGPLGLSLGLNTVLGGLNLPPGPTGIVLSNSEVLDDHTGAFATLLMVGGVEPAVFTLVDAPDWVSLTGAVLSADGTQIAGAEDLLVSVEDAHGREYVMPVAVSLTVAATIDNDSGIGEGDGDIIIPDPEDPETDEDGFEEPPVQHNTSEGLKISGKNGGTATWFKSLPLPPAGETVTFAYEADWSAMNFQGRDAAVGFAFKDGNDYHLTGLRGDGAVSTDMRGSRIYGDFRKSNQFALTDDIDAIDTVKNGPNFLQLIVSEDGSTYSLYAGSAVDELSLIQEDRIPTPIGGVDEALEFGIGGYFSNRDKGVFSITITLFESVSASDVPLNLIGFLAGFDTGFVDESSHGHVVSEFGGITRTTVDPIVGSHSALLDGVNDYLSLPAHASTSLSGDFTLDLSLRWNGSVQSYVPLIDATTSGSTLTASYILLKSGNFLVFQWYPAGSGTSAFTEQMAWEPAADTNYAVRLAREGSNFRFFSNGALLGTSVRAGTIRANTAPIFICRQGGNYASCRIDEIRITPGFAASTAAYTPALPFTRP